MTKGRKIRLNKIRDSKSENFVTIPMDHGVTSGPIKGLKDIDSTIESVARGGGDSVLLHKGIIKQIDINEDIGLIVHLNGATSVGPDPNNKVTVGTAEEVVRLGADGVSFHINVGSKTEPNQLKELGRLSGKCDEYGIPLLAMTYVRGPDIDVNADNIAHAARLGAELGADIVKTPYTRENFERVTEGCPVPVVIAGGPKAETERDILRDIKDAMQEGARGVSVGRNIFQHDDVEAMTRAVSLIVHEGATVDEALDQI